MPAQLGFYTLVTRWFKVDIGKGCTVEADFIGDVCAVNCYLAVKVTDIEAGANLLVSAILRLDIAGKNRIAGKWVEAEQLISSSKAETATYLCIGTPLLRVIVKA